MHLSRNEESLLETLQLWGKELTGGCRKQEVRVCSILEKKQGASAEIYMPYSLFLNKSKKSLKQTDHLSWKKTTHRPQREGRLQESVQLSIKRQHTPFRGQ